DGPGLEDAPLPGPSARAQQLFARVRRQADLVLWVVDAEEPVLEPAPDGARLLVWNKIDLAAARALPARSWLPRGLPAAAVSARSGAGLAELGRTVERMLTGEDRESGAA